MTTRTEVAVEEQNEEPLGWAGHMESIDAIIRARHYGVFISTACFYFGKCFAALLSKERIE